MGAPSPRLGDPRLHPNQQPAEAVSPQKDWRERRQAISYALGEVRGVLNSLGLQPNDLVLVACSGGADSLALAAIATIAGQEVGKTTRKRGFPIRVGAVIVDHQLQPDSAEVAAKTAELCRTHLVPQMNGSGQVRHLVADPVIVITAEVGCDGGPEAAARQARYEAIDQVVAETGAKAVLLGHTLDDQAEQVFLGLARGSGARSLAGMPVENGIYVRPFLRVSRGQVERICLAFDLAPWQDPTNSTDIYLRNRIRHSVMPALTAAIGPGVSEALARTAEQLAEDAEALDFYAAQLLISAVGANETMEMEAENAPYGFVRANRRDFNIAKLLQAPAAVRRRALRMAAINAGAPASDVNRTQVLAMDALVASWHGQSAHKLPGNVTVRRNGDWLVFE